MKKFRFPQYFDFRLKIRFIFFSCFYQWKYFYEFYETETIFINSSRTSNTKKVKNSGKWKFVSDKTHRYRIQYPYVDMQNIENKISQAFPIVHIATRFIILFVNIYIVRVVRAFIAHQRIEIPLFFFFCSIPLPDN